MTERLSILIAATALIASGAVAQNATTNEKGATGAYSSAVDSSFTSESRFGPRTAIDELRANIDRDREQIERVRQQQLLPRTDPPPDIEPLIFGPPPADNATEAEADATPED